jgi:hypothetical protein
MKNIKVYLFCVSVMVLLASADIYGVTCGNAITYTSIGNPRVTVSPPTIPSTSIYDDTSRLQALITACTGKIIFDEAGYNIYGTLTLYSARLLEGSGNTGVLSFPSSKIVQYANAPIFKIGPGIYNVAIRDMALLGALDLRDEEGDINTNTQGILMEGGTTNNCNPSGSPPDIGNCSSIGFQFSNLRIDNFNKGIYINALNGGEWQPDHIRIDHSVFGNNIIGIHVNTYNGGLNISDLDFLLPDGESQGTSTSIAGKTYGIYLERSTYSVLTSLIGNGPTSNGPPLGTALVYIKEHANLTIQGSVSEGFHDDIVVHGNSRNSPISLTSNNFMSGVQVKDATVYSSGNQYTGVSSNIGSPAVASGYAQIYSVGDKFCNEGTYSVCDERRGFELQDTARNIFMTTQNGSNSEVPWLIQKDVFTSSDTDINKFTSAPNLTLLAPTVSNGALLRMGRGIYVYDITRDETDGYLRFTGSQSGYGGYTFQTQGGTVRVNYDGSVTHGTVSYSSLGSATNGTVVYCDNCQQTSTCASGGSGAMARRIAGSWKCS